MSIITKSIPIKVPRVLQEIPQPPKQLFLIGEDFLDNEDLVFLTFVGSRKATSYGKQVVKTLIEDLPKEIVVVSGLAFGVDSFAHQYALEFGLKTVAFPGSGLSEKVLYPASHRQLAEKIVSSGGALVSEFPDDTVAANWTFPQRNRLMAGLSRAVIVIEAEEKSGSRITARMATDYNRDVYAIPGPIFSPLSLGTNTLIKEGAYPLLSQNQLLDDLGFLSKNKTLKKFEIPDDLPDNALLILKLLQKGNLNRTDLCQKLNLSITEINISLTVLELRNLIQEKMGLLEINYY